MVCSKMYSTVTVPMETVIHDNFLVTRRKQVINCFLGAAELVLVNKRWLWSLSWSISADFDYQPSLRSISPALTSSLRCDYIAHLHSWEPFIYLQWYCVPPPPPQPPSPISIFAVRLFLYSQKDGCALGGVNEQHSLFSWLGERGKKKISVSNSDKLVPFYALDL